MQSQLEPKATRKDEPDIALFPAREDAGTRDGMTLQAIRSLIVWANHYNLDAWAGHVCYMYGKPYITERGAIALCDQRKEYRGFSCSHLLDKVKEKAGFNKTDVVWECAVEWRGRDKPIVEYGVVSQAELDQLRNHTMANLRRSKDGQGMTEAQLEAEVQRKLLYVPLYKAPNNQARVRAMRRAHLMAVANLAPVAREQAEELVLPFPGATGP